jgi:hypothetical protein
MNNEFPTHVFVAPANYTPEPTIAVTPTIVDQMDSIEVAAYLGITTNNLRQMVFKKKLLPSGKNGRRLVFNKSDVIAFAEGRNK